MRVAERDRTEWSLAAVVVLAAAVAGLFLLDRSDSSVGTELVGPLPEAEAALGDSQLPDSGGGSSDDPSASVESAAIEIELDAGRVEVSGAVPDQETLDALTAASIEQFGEAAVTVGVSVDETLSLADATAIVSGTAPDGETARAVVASYEGLGFTIADQLVVALPPEAGTIAALLAADPDLSRFAELVSRAALVADLEAEGPITVFAPNDTAMGLLDDDTLTALEDPDTLEVLLSQHIVGGAYPADELDGVTELQTNLGEVVAVETETSAEDGDATELRITVASAELVGAGTEGANGVLHVVDRVLVPEPLSVQFALNALVGAQPVQFAPGSAQLLPESLIVLDGVAAIVVDEPDVAVEVQGHTDTDGDEAVNLELSRERAEAVVAYLVSAGVPADQLEAVGLGESRPRVDPEVTDDDKFRNRRIEFRVR